jgi:hypothetical protein
MLISFKATKNINIGEELLLDMYVDSNTNYKYLSKDFSSICNGIL